MTNTIYSKYNIDPNKLSRDYLKNPLKRGEKPTKEDLYYLYIELNLYHIELKNIFGWYIKRWKKEYNIKKSTNQIVNSIKKTKLKRYGDENYNNRKLSKQTKLERYGDEDYNNIDKIKETCLERYGVDNFTKTNEYRNKSRKTCLEKYGESHFNQTTIYQNNIEKYKQKEHLTKKKNNSFNKSKPEDEHYELLCEQFGKDDVIRQYKSDLYPFNCDFYIKSTDTYIEYQGNWTHGKEPYNPNNKEHQKLLEKWKQKDLESERTKSGKKSYYSYAIKYWTELDPLKRKTARINKLNYIEIW